MVYVLKDVVNSYTVLQRAVFYISVVMWVGYLWLVVYGMAFLGWSIISLFPAFVYLLSLVFSFEWSAQCGFIFLTLFMVYVCYMMGFYEMVEVVDSIDRAGAVEALDVSIRNINSYNYKMFGNCLDDSFKKQLLRPGMTDEQFLIELSQVREILLEKSLADQRFVNLNLVVVVFVLAKVVINYFS